MKWFRTSVVLVFFLCFDLSIEAQHFFKVSEATDLLDQKIAEFNNGDLLIGNSSTTPLRTGNENGILILKRVDFCGNNIWEKQFMYDGGYLILKDIAINQNDEIFMYGSHYKGLIESIFISKIENPSYDIADFRIFNTGSVDHFTYSLDLNNDQLLVYGLLLDFNSSKEGFIGIFDQNLNFQSASKFVPFESTGNALFSNDGGVIAWSGPYIYKFDSNSMLEWAFTTRNQQDLLNIAGPFLTSNGWIFESHTNGISYLFKLNNTGNLIWTSDQLEKTNVGGDLKIMSDGNMLFSYNREIISGTGLSFLIIDPEGNTVQENIINHSYSMNTGEMRQRIVGEDVILIGSKNLFSIGTVDIENFMLQFSFNELTANCFEILDQGNSNPNMQSTNFEQLDINPTNFQLEIIDRVNLRSSPSLEDLNDLCNPSQDIIPIVESNFIPCIDVWDVSLPSNDYRWDDGFEGSNRELSNPGIYTARNVNCLQQEILEYRLEKEECGCQIFVPNIFSPNGDETNDSLELGVFCSLESMYLLIFDKWGEMIFESNSEDKMWSGKINQQDAPAGIYSILLMYKWLDSNSELQESKIVQTLTLLR